MCCFYFFKDSAKFHKKHILRVIYINPNVPAGWMGKVRKKEEGREGGETKGLEPGTCRVLGEGSKLLAMGGCSDKVAFPCL